MQTLPEEKVGESALVRALSLASNGALYDQRAILLERETNVFVSTFHSEVLTCRLNDGSQCRLFCKRGAPHADKVYGHKGGVPYEALVYERILAPLLVSAPGFKGAHSDNDGQTWLFIDFLDHAYRVSKLSEENAMASAARWVGQFHALNESRVRESDLSFLQRYDEEYYLGWARRTARFAGKLHHRFPWLNTLCGRFEEAAIRLLRGAQTIIHGEYTPHNVLIRRGTVYPVDWESAAIGAGEIDLATLTEAWPASVETECADAYRHARWSNGVTADFENTLDCARLYVTMRWLGAKQEWTVEDRNLWRFDVLRAAGERLGLI